MFKTLFITAGLHYNEMLYGFQSNIMATKLIYDTRQCTCYIPHIL